ncbi:MAG TPA: hypothetical protein DCM39_09560, partial [Pantoea sp.]|nr:hypothetical protein [Pantoea sp.]
MTTGNFMPPWRDEAIVAWLDGEMSRHDAVQFEQDIVRAPLLAARVQDLRTGSIDFQQALAPLLEQAQQQIKAQRPATPPPAAPVAGHSRNAPSARVCSTLLRG